MSLRESGRGAKIAICGKDSPEWVLLYIATVTYGAVVVPILSEFNPVDITHIVNHSGGGVAFRILKYLGTYGTGTSAEGEKRHGS